MALDFGRQGNGDSIERVSVTIETMAAFRRRSIFGKFRSSQVSRAPACPTAAFFFLVFIFGHFMSSDIAFSARPSPLVGIRILKLVRDNDL